MKHCNTKEQVADIFTKPLRLDRFEELREWLGVRSVAEFSLRKSVGIS